MKEIPAVVLYLRVSTGKQRFDSKATSIGDQAEACIAYLNRKFGTNGYRIVGTEFIETAHGLPCQADHPLAVKAYADTESSLEFDRPALGRMLEYLESSAVDFVNVAYMSRLGREHMIPIIEGEIQNRGASILYSLEDFDDSDFGEISKETRKFTDTLYRREFLRLTKNGRYKNAREGRFVAGKPPFGYRLNLELECGVEIDENERWIVIEVFTRYLTTEDSFAKIALWLDTVCQPRMGKRWSPTSVREMIKNEFYIGRGYYNKSKRVGPKNKSKKVARPREEWIEFHPPAIVDADLFERANAKRAPNKNNRSNGSPYLLSGLVFCAECGTRYNGISRTWDGIKRYYYQQRDDRPRDHVGCRYDTIGALELESEVWELVAEKLKHPDRMIQLIQARLSKDKTQRASLIREISATDRELGKLQQRIKNLIDKFSDPDTVMAKEDYNAAMSSYVDQRQQIQAGLQAKQAELSNLSNELDPSRIQDAVERINKLIDSGSVSFEAKRKVLKLLDIKVYLSAGEIQHSKAGNVKKAPAELSRIAGALDITIAGLRTTHTNALFTRQPSLEFVILVKGE